MVSQDDETHCESDVTTKINDIQSAVDINDVQALKDAALSENGLLKDEFRRLAWPVICSISSDEKTVLEEKKFFNELNEETHFSSHPDWSVIVADVHRSVMWFDESQDIEELKVKLTHVIMSVLLSDQELCYFQGFNVVCAVILRVMGNDSFAAFRLAKAITGVHFRHLMLDRKGERMWDFLSYIFPIIGKVNLQLRRFLESADLRENVCISWILTWLGYHIGSVTFDEICRLFDFFLAMGDRYMPVYFSASLILLHADGITSCQPEMTEVFQYVKQIPDSIPFEQVIKDSVDLHKSVPLESVESEARALIQMRIEQQQLLRKAVNRRQPYSLNGYSRLWQLGYSLYSSQQVRTIAASTVALGVAYFYTRNPEALNSLLRLLRRCANTATVNIVGIDIDLLLG